MYNFVDLPEPDAPELDPITPNPNIDGNVHLNWDPVSGANYYNIYRGTSPILDISVVDPIGTNTQSDYVDVGLESGLYHYVITAVGNGGESIASNGQAVIVEIPEIPLDRKVPGYGIWFLIGVVGLSSSIIILKLKIRNDIN